MGARLGLVRLILLVIRWMGDVGEQAESWGEKQTVHVGKCWLGSPLGYCFLAKGRSSLQLVAFL